MCKLTSSLKKKEDKHRQAELFQCNFKTGVKDSDFIFTASSLTFRIYGKPQQGSDIGNGRSEVPYIYFFVVAMTVIKCDLFPAFLRQDGLFFYSCTFKMTLFQ